MTVTLDDNGDVTIRLQRQEWTDVAEFLRQFYQGDESVMDHLSDALETLLEAHDVHESEGGAP